MQGQMLQNFKLRSQPRAALPNAAYSLSQDFCVREAVVFAVDKPDISECIAYVFHHIIRHLLEITASDATQVKRVQRSPLKVGVLRLSRWDPRGQINVSVQRASRREREGRGRFKGGGQDTIATHAKRQNDQTKSARSDAYTAGRAGTPFHSRAWYSKREPTVPVITLNQDRSEMRCCCQYSPLLCLLLTLDDALQVVVLEAEDTLRLGS